MSGVVAQLVGWALVGIGVSGVGLCVVQLDRQRIVRGIAYWSTQHGRTKAEREHARAVIGQLAVRSPEPSSILSAVPVLLTSSSSRRPMRKDKGGERVGPGPA
jgi:hypothetical protein